MGQPINVVKKPGSGPGLVRFDTNRVLTGMGHERFRSPDDIVDNRTVDELARRLFDSGLVKMVHVNSNVITVELTAEDVDGSTGDELLDIIRGLHIHYPPHEESSPTDETEVTATS